MLCLLGACSGAEPSRRGSHGNDDVVESDPGPDVDPDADADADTDNPGCTAQGGTQTTGMLAQTGDCLPDDTAHLATLYAPVLAPDGSAVFVATIDTEEPEGQYVLLKASADGLTILARENGPLPGDTTRWFRSPAADELGPFRGAPRVGSDGAIAFLAAHAPLDTMYPEDDGFGLFFADEEIASTGDAAPSGSTFVFETDTAASVAVATGGLFAFGARIAGSGCGDTSTDAGLFVYGATLLRIADRCSATPDGTALFNSTDEDTLGFGPPGIGGDSIVFTAREKPTNSGLRDALYRYQDGTLSLLVRAGDEVSYLYDVKHAPSVNAAGATAFQGLDAGDDVIFTYTAALQAIARSGDPLPAGGYTYSHLSWQPSLNDSGAVAFAGSLKQGTLTNGDAVFIIASDANRTLAQTGTTAPNDTATFKAVTQSDTYLQVNPNRLHLTSAGHVAFTAELSDGGLGLYVWDPGATTLIKVVRTGDVISDRIVTNVGFQGVSSPGVQALDADCRITYLTELGGSATAVWVKDACQ